MFEHSEWGGQRVNNYLKIIGLCLNKNDKEKTFIRRLFHHYFYLIQLVLFLSLEFVSQLWWCEKAMSSGKPLLEITTLLPCSALSCHGIFISLSFLYYAHDILDLVNFMENIQPKMGQVSAERNVYVKNLLLKHMRLLKIITNTVAVVITGGVLLFGVYPVHFILTNYYNTGEVKLKLPFVNYYPWNEYDLSIYPFIYLHQMWAAFDAVYFVMAPEYFFFTCCTFIHVQFLLLQYDTERIVGDESVCDKSDLIKLLKRHIDLIKSVDSLEIIFSKSLLINVLTSSIIICVTGFNVMVNDNTVVMASFTSFLIFKLMQLFLCCYYGDNIMRSSMDISNGIYSSKWYNIPPLQRKCFLIVLTRCQRPCKLTAYGFLDINLEAFASILSTSWSYFALLKTIYHPE